MLAHIALGIGFSFDFGSRICSPLRFFSLCYSAVKTPEDGSPIETDNETENGNETETQEKYEDDDQGLDDGFSYTCQYPKLNERSSRGQII